MLSYVNANVNECVPVCVCIDAVGKLLSTQSIEKSLVQLHARNSGQILPK